MMMKKNKGGRSMARSLKGFEYFEPSTIAEATRLLSTYQPKAKVIAAGVDLISRMRHRKIEPQYVVSLTNIPGLTDIENDEKSLKFGSMTTLMSLELLLKGDQTYAALYEAIHNLSSVQVKNTATLVGNLCVATPASDMASALCALNAKLKIAGTSGERIVPIDEFYLDVGKTVLKPDEIVTQVIVPRPGAHSGNAFFNLLRVKCDVAKINVSASLTLDQDRCKDIRIALGAVAPTIVRAKKAEEQLLQANPFDGKAIAEAAQTASTEVKPITDLRSTAEYRQEMVKVLVKRALEKAWARAKE